MNVETAYPHLKKSALHTGRARKIIKLIFLSSAAITAIVNLCVGGKPWCFIAIIGIWVSWVNFLSRPLVENSVLVRLSQLLMTTCILLISIDLIYGGGFYPFVVPIVCFSFLIMLSSIFFFGFRHQKRNVMPLIWVSLSGILILVISALGAYRITWPIITLASIGLAVFVFSVICFRKPLLQELKKRFHVC